MCYIIGERDVLVRLTYAGTHNNRHLLKGYLKVFHSPFSRLGK